MTTRRDFIKVTGVTGIGALTGGCSASLKNTGNTNKRNIAQGPLVRDVMPLLEEGKKNNIRPSIRGDLLEHPQAVFIIETNVRATKDAKGSFDSAGLQLAETGYNVANALFDKGTDRGGLTTINPNLTYIPPNLRYPTIGVTITPQFTAGFYDALSEMGNTNAVVTERSSGADMLAEAGHLDIYSEHGLPFIDGKYGRFTMYEKNELNWFDINDGEVWKRVPAFRPHFDQDALTINMPTMKCHNLGLTTLSIKNMQGFVPTGYGHYCDQWHQMFTIRPEMRDDINMDYWVRVEESFLRHKKAGFRYYDYEDSYKLYREKGGWREFEKVRLDRSRADAFMKGIRNLMWDEQWAQRTVDTLSVLKPDINIVEGVISRDGNAFENGTDYLTNYVVAGLDLVAVDTVASWLMGQTPSELHYLRIAEERGFGSIDITKVPVFEISLASNAVTRVDPSDLKRYRLGIDLHRTPKEPLKFY